ncbi:relA-associated inhibitor-like [Gadus morhua]|uniref:relA-associated inhibitor-like n=1 Tax=Gadus morhua TaxID=8049 RepID=UPI0011B6769D|nr:relA-associated inhibitor-like [Gadus morhua]
MWDQLTPDPPPPPGVGEAMGANNSGVLYALWSYQGQAADELGFNEGDMVTILQKAQGVDWWWASLCGREGFVPNNNFGMMLASRFRYEARFEQRVLLAREEDNYMVRFSVVSPFCSLKTKV